MHEIRELIKLVDQSSVTDFDYEFEGLKVSIKKGSYSTVPTSEQAPPVQDNIQTPIVATSAATPVQPIVAAVPEQAPITPKAQAEQETASLHKIVSPMVGTFYSSPSPDKGPYVKVGDKVTDSSIVCIVEAMKLMNEIEAEVRGEIVDILVENGQLVEYGQALFLVKPE
jgi:acetyl-CoA carboxylase biotin carboxyl carrier protein